MSVNPQHSISTTETLPRIYSNKKLLRPPSASKDVVNPPINQITTIASESGSSLRRPRSHSDLNSLHSARKALQSANSSQAVKLEATTLIILTKIEQLQKEDYLIDKQIQVVKKDIEDLRVKQKFNTDLTQIPTIMNSTVSSRLSSNISKDPLNSKLKNLEILRKKIDREHEKYKKGTLEVDKTRRQIQTIKKLNNGLESELSNWKSRMDQQQSEVSQLELKINHLNQAVQNKKIEAVQQKAHVIREYDSILKKIDSQLKEQGSKQNTEAAYFYLTQNANPVTSIQTSGRQLRQSSPKNQKNITFQTTQLKEKTQKWSHQLQTLKQKLQATSEQELQQKIKENHEINYQRYEYLNNRYSHLNELRQRNQELQERKRDIQLKYGVQEGLSRKEKETVQIMEKIRSSKQNKLKYEQEMKKIDQLFSTLKQFVIDFGEKTGKLEKNQTEDINTQNLWGLLEQVRKVVKNC